MGNSPSDRSSPASAASTSASSEPVCGRAGSASKTSSADESSPGTGRESPATPTSGNWPAYRGAEAAGDQALRGGRVDGPGGRAVRGQSAVDVGRATPAYSDAGPDRGASPQGTHGDPREATEESAALPLPGGTDHRGADTGREGTRPGLSDVRRGGDGHRPHPPGGQGRPDRDGQPSTAVQPVPPSEDGRGLEGGEQEGSLQYVERVDVLCGGFP